MLAVTSVKVRSEGLHEACEALSKNDQYVEYNAVICEPRLQRCSVGQFLPTLTARSKSSYKADVRDANASPCDKASDGCDVQEP